MSKTKETEDKQQNVATTMKPGTNYLKGKTREELADKLNELEAPGGHLVVGAVGQDTETGEFMLRVDYILNQ